MINSSILSTPIHSLTASWLPNSHTESFNKVFIWSNNTASKVLQLIPWNIVTAPKNYGGLSIKDFSILRVAIQCKRFMDILNNNGNIWVNLVIAEHGSLDLWDLNPTIAPLGAGRVFFEGSFRFENGFQESYWGWKNTSFHEHAWCFDLPFHVKLTLISTEIFTDNISIPDFLRRMKH